jgi:HEAT repeat protein
MARPPPDRGQVVRSGYFIGRVIRVIPSRAPHSCQSARRAHDSGRALLIVLALALSPAPAAASLLWPDVPARIERDLGSADANARRAAAAELSKLGSSRGTPLVLRALEDTDTEVRLAAAQSAARLRVTAATEAVLPWLGDRDSRLRVAACEVARAMPNPRAVQQLARALGDADANVRSSAADALGAQANPEAVAPLLGKLDDASPPVRIQIARSLARLADKRAVVPLVGKAQDSVPEVRQAVARALGELGDARASQALLLQLRDNSIDVRVEALAALGRMRAPDAVDAIAPLAVDRNIALRQAALAALGRIATPDSVHALIVALGSGEDASGGVERTPVREALTAAGAVAIAPLTAELRSSAFPQILTSAAWVLGELKAKSAAPDIIHAMRRGALPVPPALHALAGAGTPESLTDVLEFIDDGSAVVRAEASGAAAALLEPSQPDGRAVEPIAAALRDARLSNTERARLAGLLGRTGAPRAEPVLAGLLGSRDPVLKLGAIDALGQLGPAGADDPLLHELGDTDPLVRLHTAIALGDAGGTRARDVLLDKLDAGEELDRSALLTALGGVLARLPTPDAVKRVERALRVAAGPERDAIIVALGRATFPSASGPLSSLSSAPDPDDRRMLASVLAAHPARADAADLLRTLLKDTDASVRAQAAWGLGEIGDASVVPALETVIRAMDLDAAANASAAIGRIAGRARSAEVGARLCPFLADARARVRANALTGLALAGARCQDGAAERRLLTDDSDAVRSAAALVLARKPVSPEDRLALDRCAATDRAGAVSHLCRSPPGSQPAVAARAVEIYVMGDAPSTPRPHAEYVVEFADGMLRAGTADRRGALFDPAAPAGTIALRRPTSVR